MKSRGMLMVLLSLVLGVGAAWAAKQWVEQRARAMENKDPGEAVIVAAIEIPYGTRVEARHVKSITVATGTPLGDHFEKVEDIVGTVSTQKALPGEVLLKERFAKGAGSTLAALIRPDMRAVTVRVDDVIGVAGFLLPGNKVDVVAARKVNERSNERSVTETILEALNVLAVDQTASQDANQPVVVRAVTLEMTPKQAEILVRAREEGRIQLTLRNPSDEAENLLAKVEPTPTPAPAAKRVRQSAPKPALPTVTIIRGTHVDSATTGS
ncbi:MAG: Flp pilus assembly protein CpaB [Steroidobacteraceae bacterium]